MERTAGEARAIRFEGHDGDPVGGWLVAPPAESESSRAIVLVHEVYGLDRHVRALAGRLAAEGYTVLAPDLYAREGTPGPVEEGQAGAQGDGPAPPWTPEAIRAAVAGLPDRRALGDLDAAARRLAAEPGVDARSVAVVGFCMGGTLALMLGCTSRHVACVVDFYGGPLYRELSANKPTQPLELHLNLDVPLLALFGERDAHIPAEHVELLRERLSMAGKDFEIVTLPDAGHGFLNDTRPGYAPAAAEEAWRRTLAFLDERL